MLPILKSAFSVVAGLIIAAFLSVVTDIICQKTGLMKPVFNTNSTWFILIIIIYRSAYEVIGAFITASQAPSSPMRHALILGGIALFLSILGIKSEDEEPVWYAVSLIVLALPTAWLGGYLWKVKHKPQNNLKYRQ